MHGQISHNGNYRFGSSEICFIVRDAIINTGSLIDKPHPGFACDCCNKSDFVFMHQ